MAKSKMQLKYKSPKRERNKNKNSNEIELKSFLITFISVLVFIGVVYLGVLGLKALGAFEAGYTKPSKEATKIDYEYIMLGTVFNKNEKDYYVIFDDYSKNENTYINTLVDNNGKIPVYKVDLSKGENKACISEKGNPKATSDNELKINGITLIKITKGKISKYLEGTNKIEEQFK